MIKLLEQNPINYYKLCIWTQLRFNLNAKHQIRVLWHTALNNSKYWPAPIYQQFRSFAPWELWLGSSFRFAFNYHTASSSSQDLLFHWVQFKVGRWSWQKRIIKTLPFCLCTVYIAWFAYDSKNNLCVAELKTCALVPLLRGTRKSSAVVERTT